MCRVCESSKGMPVQCFQNLAGSQVELVQDNPVAAAHRRDQRALPERQAPILICHIAAQVLLQGILCT